MTSILNYYVANCIREHVFVLHVMKSIVHIIQRSQKNVTSNDSLSTIVSNSHFIF